MADENKMTKKERRALKKQQKLDQQYKEESRRKRNKILTFLGIGLAILVVGYLIFQSQVPVPESEQQKPVDQVLENDWIKGNPDAEIKRSLLNFSFGNETSKTTETSVLIIETERHQYTKDYIKLTKDFYLKM